ncbi:reverse transcriptase family protein [Mixta calida]|uniref:RNA-directed DNA polymerase n=1 Tax=Mixta calida TaxID=665913 RepID=A0ABM6S1A3_9GAMM|nr:reverse transcriptase family protein [Mixta calida]AUY25610.1 RNA-directed DNA polymerase [Mixta calida]
MDKPYYPYKAISSIETLAKTLGIRVNLLSLLVEKSDSSYHEFIVCTKKGKDRTVYEPKPLLKRLQKKINSRIFEKVKYPVYLQGGIKDEINKRDYVENALLHSKNKPKQLIGLDIKSFYDNIKSDKVFDIYKYFFKFPDPVSDALTKLTTFKGKLPQGACTSSYLANLVFFNSEYNLVSYFRNMNITYTRLLDDVTLSSPVKLSEKQIGESIKKVVAMFRKYNLKHNNKKTSIECNRNLKNGFQVTGLWVGHATPKTTRDERRYVRLLVKTCEQKYKNNPYTEEYHELWNKTSGLVAKLKRLNQPSHDTLRNRLSLVLPLYDAVMVSKLMMECKSLLRVKNKIEYSVSEVNHINKTLYKLGILSRNNPGRASIWRKKIIANFKNLPTKRELWE